MKSIFLSHEQIFGDPLPLFRRTGTAVQAGDLVLATADDEGFTFSSGCVNCFLSGEDCVDRFGRDSVSGVCAVRPAILLDPGDEMLLSHRREVNDIVTVELGTFPSVILDHSMRDMAEEFLVFQKRGEDKCDRFALHVVLEENSARPDNLFAADPFEKLILILKVIIECHSDYAGAIRDLFDRDLFYRLLKDKLFKAV